MVMVKQAEFMMGGILCGEGNCVKGENRANHQNRGLTNFRKRYNII